MTSIADELREWVEAHRPEHGVVWVMGDEAMADLADIADRIDLKHDAVMAQSRREVRRATVHYVRSVLNDYECGIKRVRKERHGQEA